MIIRTEHLVILNNKNKVQHVLLQLEQSELDNTYCIYRTTNQYGGKLVKQPTIKITFGKVRRTISEQAGVQFNELLKKYLNKGYKRLCLLTTASYSSLNEQNIKTLLGETFTTNSSGIPRPMLCKSLDSCSINTTEKCWFVSKEIDGCRMLMYYKNGEVHTASFSGKNYDPATTHLRTNINIVNLFKEHPHLILDGKIYKHDINYPLQYISKLCKLDHWTDECGNLEYWIFDYISNEPFHIRYNTLMEFKSQFISDLHIKIMDHEYVCGFYKIKKRHDQYVREGFEGLIMRNPYKEYGVNRRSSKYMIKMKYYQSDEFLIVNIKNGLHPEDTCFILQTKDGKLFEAKPIGSTEILSKYSYNSTDYIGKKATCNFFYYSANKIPLQPICVHVRTDYE